MRLILQAKPREFYFIASYSIKASPQIKLTRLFTNTNFRHQTISTLRTYELSIGLRTVLYYKSTVLYSVKSYKSTKENSRLINSLIQMIHIESKLISSVQGRLSELNASLHYLITIHKLNSQKQFQFYPEKII